MFMNAKLELTITTKPITPIRCKVVEFEHFISGGVYVGNKVWTT